METKQKQVSYTYEAWVRAWEILRDTFGERDALVIYEDAKYWGAVTGDQRYGLAYAIRRFDHGDHGVA
jgi:hypothetical protein